MKRKNILVSSVIASSVLLGITSADACTSFVLKAQDNTVLVTRTMEFAMDLQSNLRTSPEGRTFKNTLADGTQGMSWTSKYGFIYLDGFQIDAPIQGMNEAGLAFAGLMFPGANSQYQMVPKGMAKKSMPYTNFGAWVLGNFNNVDDLKKALTSVYVTPMPLAQLGNSSLPLHFFVQDASGKGIVIEYVNGQLNVYDDEVGVLTNSPSYDWQIKNIGNYVNLSPYTPKPIVVGNMTFESTGQGSGMRGLPGDISPPSRFIKILALKSTLLPTQNAMDTLNAAQHIINNVDIPLGYVRAKQANGPDLNEWTQWTVFEDLTHKMFYYHTYTDMTLHAIDLSKINFAPGAPILKMPLAPDTAVIVDNTALLSQSAVH